MKIGAMLEIKELQELTAGSQERPGWPFPTGQRELHPTNTWISDFQLTERCDTVNASVLGHQVCYACVIATLGN